MNKNAALISVNDIINTYRVDRGKTVHEWWKYAPLACKAVQELMQTTIPIVQHVKLYKEPNAPYFKLPEGFVDWVSVGMFYGNRYIPVPVSNNLLPFLPQNCEPNQFDGSFGADFKHGGEYKSWLNKECNIGGDDFFAPDFLNDDYSDSDASIPDTECCGNQNFAYGGVFPFTTGRWFAQNLVGEFTKGMFTFLGRPDEVAFNIPKKMIVVPDCFPSNCLYLVYVGSVQADTMTHIPLIAQACIESYIDWQVALKKRDNLAAAREYHKLYTNEWRILRGKLNPLTTTSIYRIINKGYVSAGWGYGEGYNGSGSDNCNTTVVYQKKQAVVFLSAQEGSVVTSALLVGTNTSEVAFLIYNDVTKNTGFTINPDTGSIIFTDGTYVMIGDKITVYYV